MAGNKTKNPQQHFLPDNDKDALIRKMVQLSFFNLFLLACVGVLLRAFPFVELPFAYRHLLHTHSHFAFGGWVMPVLLAAILRTFPEIREAVSYIQWRTAAALLIVAAYGMLFSFPFQGYGPVSIIFSTLSV